MYFRVCKSQATRGKQYHKKADREAKERQESHEVLLILDIKQKPENRSLYITSTHCCTFECGRSPLNQPAQQRKPASAFSKPS